MDYKCNNQILTLVGNFCILSDQTKKNNIKNFRQEWQNREKTSEGARTK